MQCFVWCLLSCHLESIVIKYALTFTPIYATPKYQGDYINQVTQFTIKLPEVSINY